MQGMESEIQFENKKEFELSKKDYKKEKNKFSDLLKSEKE